MSVFFPLCTQIRRTSVGGVRQSCTTASQSVILVYSTQRFWPSSNFLCRARFSTSASRRSRWSAEHNPSFLTNQPPPLPPPPPPHPTPSTELKEEQHFVILSLSLRSSYLTLFSVLILLPSLLKISCSSSPNLLWFFDGVEKIINF